MKQWFAQALLIQGAKQVVVEDNLFAGNFGVAIFPQSAQYWEEGRWPDNILIRNNSSHEDGSWGQPAIQVFPGLSSPSSQALIQNVIIDGNMIYSPGSDGIRVNDITL